MRKPGYILRASVSLSVLLGTIGLSAITAHSKIPTTKSIHNPTEYFQIPRTKLQSNLTKTEGNMADSFGVALNNLYGRIVSRGTGYAKSNHPVRRYSDEPSLNSRKRKTDGNNIAAREWIAQHVSGKRWKAISSSGKHLGYFQLPPDNLKNRRGKIVMTRKNQINAADRYVHSRYGNWLNAKHSYQKNGWY